MSAQLGELDYNKCRRRWKIDNARGGNHLCRWRNGSLSMSIVYIWRFMFTGVMPKENSCNLIGPKIESGGTTLPKVKDHPHTHLHPPTTPFVRNLPTSSHPNVRYKYCSCFIRFMDQYVWSACHRARASAPHGRELLLPRSRCF